MKLKVSIVVVTIFSFSIFAQNVVVPKKVQDEFMKLYPKTTEVKWSKENKKEFEAEFKVDGKAISVVIDNQGKLKETESEISKSGLPKGVEEFVAKNHTGWAITETAKIVDAKGSTKFEVQISKDKVKKDLMFTNDGKPMVKKEVKEEKNENEEKEED